MQDTTGDPTMTIQTWTIHPYWGRRWTRALRATPAPQIREAARDDQGGRCAVGVIAELLIVDGLLPDWDAWLAPESWDEALANERAFCRAAPLSVRRAVVGMNDAGRRTFREIADWLDRQIDAQEAMLARESGICIEARS